MKKTLTDIDGAVRAQRGTGARPRPDKNADITFGFFKKQDGQLGMGNKYTTRCEWKDFIGRWYRV